MTHPYLKGNYELHVDVPTPAASEIEPRAWEKEALARLGGSVCFVSTKAFIWKGDRSDAAGS